jgi:hypothetical protein
MQTVVSFGNGARSWIQANLGPDFIALIDQEAGSATNNYEYIRLAFKFCIESEWSATPPYLVRLIDQLTADGQCPAIPDLQAIKDRINRREDPRLERIKAIIVKDWLPFLDRTDFRTGLQTLFDRGGNGRALMVVSGDGRCGKSYTARLIEFACEEGVLYEVIQFELREGQEQFMNPQKLADKLGRRMWPDSSCPTYDPEHRDIDSYKEWVRAQAERSRKRWCIVLDSFRRLPKQNLTRQLIQALAGAIVNEAAFSKWMRLSLIDYDEALAGVLPEQCVPEIYTKIKSEEIQEKDVRAFLETICRKYNRTPSAERLDTLTAGAMKQIPAAPSRLDSINQNVRAIAEGIRTGALLVGDTGAK